jgi:hypothetical protein
MSYYGWCPHRKDLRDDQACLPCERKAQKAKEASRKAHGESCTCSVCDWDDYWKHLGKQ